jgi:hypothetical protein
MNRPHRSVADSKPAGLRPDKDRPPPIIGTTRNTATPKLGAGCPLSSLPLQTEGLRFDGGGWGLSGGHISIGANSWIESCEKWWVSIPKRIRPTPLAIPFGIEKWPRMRCVHWIAPARPIEERGRGRGNGVSCCPRTLSCARVRGACGTIKLSSDDALAALQISCRSRARSRQGFSRRWAEAHPHPGPHRGGGRRFTASAFYSRPPFVGAG